MTCPVPFPGDGRHGCRRLALPALAAFAAACALTARGKQPEGNLMQSPDWRKSSYSFSNQACIETATAASGVLVPDTKDRDGAVLAFGAGAWAAFTAGLKGGAR